MAEFDFFDDEEDAVEVPEEQQSENARQLDAPIPGQSLTAEPGSMPYEQPPQYTELSEAMDFMFDNVTQPKPYKDFLNMADSGVPISMIVQSILMFGASSGKFNIDLAMLMVEPLTTILAGLAVKENIIPVFETKKKEEEVDVASLRKIFKKDEKKEEVKLPEVKEEVKPQGFLAGAGGIT